jgi:hypothetical protein
VISKRPSATKATNSERGGGRFLQRLSALLLGLALIALLPILGLFVATTAGSAQRIIARAVPAFTELDGLVSLHGADMQSRAQADSRSPVVMPEFPISVSLPASQVANASPQRLETLLAERSGAAIYQRGFAAFALSDTRPTNRTGPLLSPQWAMHEALGLLNVRTHGLITKAIDVVGLVTLALLLIFFVQVRSYGRLVGLGVISLLAAILAGLLTLLVWLFMQLNYGGATSALGSAAWGMVADVAWTMLLVDLVAAICAIAVVAVGYVFARIDSDALTDVRVPQQTQAPPATDIARPRSRALDRLPKPPPPSSN